MSEERAPEDIGCDVILEEIANRIGHEVQIAVARIVRELRIEIAFGFLLGNDPVGILLVLPLIDVGRIESAFAEGRVRPTSSWAPPDGWATEEVSYVARLPRIVRNLVPGLAETRNGDKARTLV